MDELIQQLQSRVGLDADKAQQAAATAIAFVKDKLPAPIAQQLESLLSGGTAALGDLADKLPGGVGDKLGDLFGKKD